MEVWILLAAAGSGYLARRWQNAQKPKGSSADEAEDEAGAGPSHSMPSSRGRYRHFSCSERRQSGKLIHTKGSPSWTRPKTSVNTSEHNAGVKVGGDDIKNTDGEHHKCSDRSACTICLDSGELDPVETSCARLDMQSKDDDKETSSITTGGNDSSSQMHSGISLPQSQTEEGHGVDGDTQEYHEVRSFGDPLYLMRSGSGKRSNDSFDGTTVKGSQLCQDGYAGKRMKDAVVITKDTNQSEASALGAWMPGYWDVSEGVFVLDTESLLIHQGDRSRGSSNSSRKSRTPNKYGRSKGIRKRILAGQKPMSSLESCLSAQLDDDNSRRHNGSVRHSHRQVLKDSCSFASEGKAGPSKTEFAIGLPSISRIPSRKFSSKSRTPNISECDQNVNEEPFNPFACQRYKSTDGVKWESRKGKLGSSTKGLLFNFGVGVGMMFTVMSNMREVRRLTLLLKEAESLIKDLEDELERKDEEESSLQSIDARSEKKQNFISSTLRKVRSATESLCSMRMALANEPAISSERLFSKDMSKLEAELEAELERMELNLGDGDFKLRNKSTERNEMDGEVGSLVHGDLTVHGLPHELEVDSEGNSSSSSHDDNHVHNYAVSPRALAKRLHEVLEAQQERRISQLEMELSALNRKLKAKEDEIKTLQTSSQELLAAGEVQGFSIMDYKEKQFSPSRSQKGNTRSSDIEEDTPKLKYLKSPNVSPVLQYTSSNVSSDVSVFRKGIEDKSAAFITLGGEALAAYKEACDEFSKLNTGLDQPHISEKRKSEKYGKERLAKESKPEAKHYGSSDGLEQVDLISLAEDFYGGEAEFPEGLPLYKILHRGRRGSRRKPRVRGHPEPEQSFSYSRGVDSSDDATNDTSGSTPCSIKFIDMKTVGSSGNEGKQSGDEQCKPSLSSCNFWSPEISIRAGVNTPDQEGLERISGKVSPSSQDVFNLPYDSDLYSDLDEHLGQLLIKRIVKKTREGSPIVQDAQNILEHLERNYPTHNGE
ncbi:hypothetical protein KP509_22G002300 [Ceratopteris richardii]|uniref:Uncharacterized protein n=1 Tax=Ceratopteris richardii TaxID=49495 RepID=A0A8T2S455_CERRI|nr:hypothetical protein KP509_22G002300 [Ceratopteris richardii]